MSELMYSKYNLIWYPQPFCCSSLSLKLYLPYKVSEGYLERRLKPAELLCQHIVIPRSWLVIALIWNVLLGLGLCSGYMLVSPTEEQSSPPVLAHSPQRASQKASQAPRAWAFLLPEHDARFKPMVRTNICMGFDPSWTTMGTDFYWVSTQQHILRIWFSLFLPAAQLECWHDL